MEAVNRRVSWVCDQWFSGEGKAGGEQPATRRGGESCEGSVIVCVPATA